MRQTLQINRRGVIVVGPEQATDFQCVVKGHPIYYYDCKIVVNDASLDSRGFIADHEEINEIIQQLCKESMPSCELIAAKTSSAISRALISKGIRHNSVYIRISGVPTEPTAYMEAWAYPDESDFISGIPIPTPKHRFLTISELKRIPGIELNLDDDGDYEITGLEGYYYKEVISNFAGDELPEDVITQLVTDDDGDSSYASLASSRSVRQWSTTMYSRWKDEYADDAQPKKEEEKLDITKWRYKTKEEFDADPNISKDEDDDYKDNTPSNPWFTAEMNYLFGIPFNGSEEDLREILKGGDSYVPGKTKDSTWSISLYMLTDAPLPEEKPKLKPLRFKTWEEMAAIPGASVDGWAIRGGGRHSFMDTMKPFCGRQIPEGFAELLRQGRVAHMTFEQAGITGHENVGDWAIEPWMVTDEPPVEYEEVYVMESYEVLANKPEIWKDDVGDLRPYDRRIGDQWLMRGSYFKPGGSKELELSVSEVEEAIKNNKSQIAPTLRVNTSHWRGSVEPWMLKKIRRPKKS